MGKRKSSKRTQQKPKREPVETTFTCLYCHHDKSVTVKIARKEGISTLVCKVCDQRYQSKAHHLTDPIDIYSEWIDAADAAQGEVYLPSVASSSRAPVAAVEESGDEE